MSDQVNRKSTTSLRVKLEGKQTPRSCLSLDTFCEMTLTTLSAHDFRSIESTWIGRAQVPLRIDAVRAGNSTDPSLKRRDIGRSLDQCE